MSWRQQRRSKGFGYTGFVYVDPSRDRWIAKHQSFASKRWIISNVKYGEWMWRNNGGFDVLVRVPQATKILTVVLRCRRFPNGGPHCSFRDYVHVFGSHVIRKKPR